jgi:phospholipase/carboxylesterase
MAALPPLPSRLWVRPRGADAAAGAAGPEGSTPDGAEAAAAERPAIRPGVYAVGPGKQARLVVPPTLSTPRLLLVMLHGAGGTPEMTLPLVTPAAEELGIAVLAPKSVGVTWDVLLSGYGPDVAALDATLDRVFAFLDIGPGGVAIGGFSDGASYGLSLGLDNGELFEAIVAFSAGFIAPLGPSGSPRIWMSHGRHDKVLPIDECGRPLSQVLRSAGYGVAYTEFDGGHKVPPDLALAAMEWLRQPD